MTLVQEETIASLPPSDLRDRLEDAVVRKRSSLVRFIQSKVESVEVAEDILQDVLYQVVRAADASEAIEDVTAWLYHAAKNRIVDWYRKRKPEAMPEGISDRYASDSNPEADMTQVLQWESFVDALAELPPKQREVFVMHEMEGRPFEEIAELTGEKINTLLSRKRYAVLSLRKMLQGHYDDLKN